MQEQSLKTADQYNYLGVEKNKSKHRKVFDLFFVFISIVTLSSFFFLENGEIVDTFTISIMGLFFIVPASLFYFKNKLKVLLFYFLLIVSYLFSYLIFDYYKLRTIIFNTDVKVYVKNIRKDNIQYIVTHKSYNYTDYDPSNTDVKFYKKGDKLNFKYAELSAPVYSGVDTFPPILFLSASEYNRDNYKYGYDETPHTFTGMDTYSKEEFGFSVDDKLRTFIILAAPAYIFSGVITLVYLIIGFVLLMLGIINPFA